MKIVKSLIDKVLAVITILLSLFSAIKDLIEDIREVLKDENYDEENVNL